MDQAEPFRTRPADQPLWLKVVIGVLGFFVLMLVIAIIVMGSALKSARDDIKHLKGSHNSTSGVPNTLPSGIVVLSSAVSSIPGLNTVVVGGPVPIGAWNTKASMTRARSDAEAETIGNYIYVMGGTVAVNNGLAVVNWTERYDAVNDAWKPVASMLTARGRFAAEAVGNKIYVFGGRDSSDTLITSIEAYDSVSDTWTAVGTVQTARSDMSAASLPDGRIIVTGGYDQNYNVLNLTELWDPSTNKWSSAASLNFARGDIDIVTVGGKIFISGGFGEGATYPALSSTEEYLPNEDLWVVREAMPLARGDCGIAELDDRYYMVVGGQIHEAPTGRDQDVHDVDVFDTQTGIWYRRAALEEGSFRKTCAFAAGRVFCFGGHTCKSDSGCGPQGQDPALVELQSTYSFADQLLRYHVVQ